MKKILSIATLIFLVSACASESSIEKKTAHALGVDSVKISNVDRGLYDISYKAVDENGTRYNCNIYGGNAMSFGIAISPSCTKVSGSATESKQYGACNPMLKAAGKCK